MVRSVNGDTPPPLAALVSVLLVVATGCRDDRLRPVLPPGARVDAYAQRYAAEIDVLWIVDNSGSMEPRQENLARNFQGFIDVFAASAVDYRLAVTTTDVFREAGRFIGNPAVLSPATPSVATAFAANVRVGTGGAPYEVGMDAARLAIERQATENASLRAPCERSCAAGDETCRAHCEAAVTVPFLRPRAYLYVVFVSDEDDKSERDVRFYHRFLATAKGIGNDGTVRTAAIVGDVPSNGCGAAPGVKYHALSAVTGGAVGSICDGSFGTTLVRLATDAVGLRRRFPLQALPELSTLEVRLRYPCDAPPAATADCASTAAEACAGAPPGERRLVCTPVAGGSDGWRYDAEDNVVVFEGRSIPGASADVELQYFELGKAP